MPAHAYEFAVHARTVGQGYELRSFRLLGSDLLLNRRRFTQTLSIQVWNIGKPPLSRRLFESESARGPRYSFKGYLRIDHDFGAWTGGQVLVDRRLVDAIDLVPELESSSLALDLLYGYFAAEGLAGGKLDVYIGRQLSIDTLDWWNMDGVLVRAQTPWPVQVEAFGGLRVRDSSPLGSAGFEPDGTSGAECAEYVEGTVPGTGSWRPIDRDIPGTGSVFASDFDFCPQRRELMPTFGAAIRTHGLRKVWARLGYRRSQSRTVGLIGPVDRFAEPDLGLYPNEDGRAQKWGVNEERLAASVRGDVRTLGGQLTPHAAARYSLLHGLVDEAHLGARYQRGAHAVEPEAYYSFPTFDGDSIFNVFSSEPYTDLRMTYDFSPDRSPWRGFVRGWGRRYATEDADEVRAGESVDAIELAGGVQGGVQYRRRGSMLARLDLFHEDGYGGRRTGGFGALMWRRSSTLALSGRLSVIDFDDALLRGFSGVSVGAQVGTTYQVNEGVTLHLIAEENRNRIYNSQFRLIGVIDLAFYPEN